MQHVLYLLVKRTRWVVHFFVLIPLLVSCAFSLIACLCYGAEEEGADVDPRISTEVALVSVALMGIDGDVPPVKVDEVRANFRRKISRPLDEASRGIIDRRQLVEKWAAVVVGDDSYVSMHAAMGLTRLVDKGDVRVAEAMIMALRDKREYVRGNAAAVLDKVGDRRAVEPLIVLLSDASAAVAANAASALGEIDNVRAVKPLILLLGRVQQENPCGYDRSNCEHVVPQMPLMWMIDRDLEERYRRGGLDPDYATASFSIPLIQILESKNKNLCAYVQWHAANALRKITGKRFGQQFDLWLMWWQQKERERTNKATIVKYFMSVFQSLRNLIHSIFRIQTRDAH